MIEKFLNFLFPPKCPFCSNIIRKKAPVCDNCIKNLPFTPDKVCRICSRPLEEYSHIICPSCRKNRTYFEHAFIPLIYKDSAKDAILALKSSHPYYAKGFSYLLADKILSSEFYTQFDYITYVPQNSVSKRKRGYNQAELIAKGLSKLLGVPCVSTLRRTNDGDTQHTLNAAKRRENVKKCYFKKDLSFSGTALLVDDIYTTGATANYCSKLLRQMGFEKVYLAICLIRSDD